MRKCLRERGVKFADSKAPIIALFTYEQEKKNQHYYQQLLHPL